MKILEFVLGHRAFSAFTVIRRTFPLSAFNRSFKSLVEVHTLSSVQILAEVIPPAGLIAETSSCGATDPGK
jgi:hypothetical protein